MIELKDTESSFASAILFSSLEVISTLGVGGFGRVELVRILCTLYDAHSLYHKINYILKHLNLRDMSNDNDARFSLGENEE